MFIYVFLGFFSRQKQQILQLHARIRENELRAQQVLQNQRGRSDDTYVLKSKVHYAGKYDASTSDLLLCYVYRLSFGISSSGEPDGQPCVVSTQSSASTLLRERRAGTQTDLIRARSQPPQTVPQAEHPEIHRGHQEAGGEGVLCFRLLTNAVDRTSVSVKHVGVCCCRK